MRISTSYIQQQNIDSMLKQQADLLKTQNQVSTGKRFSSASEDPISAVRVLDIERQMNLNEQYIRNADTAKSKLESTDGVLKSAANILQRIRELGVQALNDSNDANARKGIAEEVDQLNKALLGLANTRDANGESLFAGYQSDQLAFNATTYAYQGDTGQRSVRVGDSYLVEINEPGSAVFVTATTAATVTAGGTDPQLIFETINDFVTALRNNTVNTAPNDKEFLQNLDKGLESVNLARARVGTRLNGIEQQKSINSDIKTSNQALLAEIRDLDYAEAIARLNIQLTGLQAAQQSYVRVQNLSVFNYL
jgi:flagellar hook-associated protein 3 FlgL